MKSLYTSKTFWLAVIQALIAIVTVFSSSYPGVGIFLVVKSMLDIILRIETTTAIVPSSSLPAVDNSVATPTNVG